VAALDLDSDSREFVEAVMLPLGHKDTQRVVLEKAVALAAGMPTSVAPDALEVAMVRMRATAPTSKRRSIAFRLFTVVVLALSLAFLFSPAVFRSLSRTLLVNNSFEFLIPDFVDDVFPEDTTEQDIRDWMVERIAPAQRLVAMGDLHETDDPRRWEAVWKARPEDPAHFYAYVLAYRRSWYKWPADWVATGERLDPGNGWFPLIDACSRIGEVIEPEKKPARGRTRGAPPIPGEPARVKDEAALASLLTEMDRALAMLAFNDHRPRLHALRMEAWPPPVDYPEQILSFQFREQHPERLDYDSASIYQLPLLFQGAALHFANDGNRKELDALAARYERIFQALCGGDRLDLGHGVTLWHAATQGGKALENAYGILGDPGAAVRFKNFAEALRYAANRTPTTPRGRDERASTLAGHWTAGQLLGISPLTESELRGGRLAEYAMTERVLVHVLAALLCCVLGLLLFTAHHPRSELRRLADRLLQLLAYRDWLWIITLGVVMPITLYLLLQRLPWPGFRSRTIDEDRVSVMALQLAGLCLSLLLWTVEATRWRLAKRAWILGFGWRFLDAGPAFALFALSSIPFMSAVPKLAEMPKMDNDWIEAAVAIAFGLPLLWALVILISCCLKRSLRHLHRLILLRACTRVLSVGIVLSIISIFAIHAEEKKWTARIEFESVANKDHYATGSRAGFEQAKWIQEELRAIFGPLPR
jgi:hypothetical protein